MTFFIDSAAKLARTQCRPVYLAARPTVRTQGQPGVTATQVTVRTNATAWILVGAEGEVTVSIMAFCSFV